MQIDEFTDWPVCLDLLNENTLLVIMNGYLQAAKLDLVGKRVQLEHRMVLERGLEHGETSLVLDPIALYTTLFDPHLFMVIDKAHVSIFHKSCLWSLAIRAKDAQFLSARSILIWTWDGNCFVYYLGGPQDLKRGQVGLLPADCIVLASDGFSAIYVDHLDAGVYTDKQITLIASLKTNKLLILSKKVIDRKVQRAFEKWTSLG